MSDEQRTEQPTQQRREDARREGRVARSRDLTVATSLLGVFLALGSLGPFLVEQVLGFTRALLGQVSAAPRILEAGLQGGAALGPGLAGIGTDLVLLLAYCSLPVALASCAAVLLAHVAQGAWVFVPHTVMPQVGRVNPLEGARRLGSSRSLFRGVFAAFKLLVVGGLLWQMVTSWLSIDGPAASLAGSWKEFWESLVGFGVRLSFYLVLLALVEYGVQRWLHERSLRMTRDEIRKEAQRQEGDPGIKDRRRRFHAASGSSRARDAGQGLGDAEGGGY